MKICTICGREISDDSEAVECSVCKASMHRKCMDEEALFDADGNPLCPYDAALAALDWLDTVLTLYAHSFNEEQLEDLIERLRSYLRILEERREMLVRSRSSSS